MATLKSGTVIAGATAWHSLNDGAGSGLDADLVDGLQPSAMTVATATKLTTARTIAITGKVTAVATSFDGSADISIATT
jgi:hypothetical protein